MVHKRLQPLLLLFIFLPILTTAQQQAADSLWERSAVQKILTWYKDSIGGYQGLYNGIEYTGSYPGTTGHPYFEWDTLQPATIKYDGIFYPDIALKYDLVSNEVVLLGKQNLSISLLPEKIDFFSIREHIFIKAKRDSSNGQLGAAQFYEVLYEGPATILANRKKKVERSSRVEDPFIFKTYATYLVKKEGVYQTITNEKSLLSLFGDKRDILKNYIRKNKLNFRKDFENSLIKTVSYYDQLKN